MIGGCLSHFWIELIFQRGFRRGSIFGVNSTYLGGRFRLNRKATAFGPSFTLQQDTQRFTHLKTWATCDSQFLWRPKRGRKKQLPPRTRVQRSTSCVAHGYLQSSLPQKMFSCQTWTTHTQTIPSLLNLLKVGIRSNRFVKLLHSNGSSLVMKCMNTWKSKAPSEGHQKTI